MLFFVYSYIYRLFPGSVQYNSRSTGSATGDALHRIVHRAKIRYRNSDKFPHNIDIREWEKNIRGIWEYIAQEGI